MFHLRGSFDEATRELSMKALWLTHFSTKDGFQGPVMTVLTATRQHGAGPFVIDSANARSCGVMDGALSLSLRGAVPLRVRLWFYQKMPKAKLERFEEAKERLCDFTLQPQGAISHEIGSLTRSRAGL